MNSIYDLGSSVYNYFYPPQDSQEVIAKRETALKIKEVQKKLSDLTQLSYSTNLKSYLLEEKTYVLENLSKFNNQFFEVNFFSPSDVREYIKFLITEGFVKADDNRIIALFQNLDLLSKLDLIQFVLNKKADSSSFELESRWSEYMGEVFIKVLETCNNTYYSSVYKENVLKVLELLENIRNKTGDLKKFFGPFSVFPKRFSSLVNQLVSSDRMRSSLWWGDAFSVLYYPVLSFALDSGIEITSDNAMKLFSYRNNISSSSTNILALYEELTDKYLSKQDGKTLVKLALDAAYQQESLYFFKKIVQCDRLNEDGKREGATESCFFDEILEQILKDYKPYSSNRFLEVLFEFLNPTPGSIQYDLLIEIVVDGLIIFLDSDYYHYDYDTEQKVRDICKLLCTHVIHDFYQLKNFCCSIEEKLGKHLDSKRDKRRVGTRIAELLYQHLSSSLFKMDPNTQEDSPKHFLNHPLIQEIQAIDKSSNNLSVYRLSLAGILMEAPSSLIRFFCNSISGEPLQSKEVSEYKVKMVEFMDVLAKCIQPACSSFYESSTLNRELISELIDKEYFSVEELGLILINLKNPLLYAHYVLTLQDELEGKVFNKLPRKSTYLEVKKQVAVVFDQYGIDYGLFAKSYSLTEGYCVDKFSSLKAAKEYILDKVAESIYEMLIEKREEKRRNYFSSSGCSFSEMLSDLEEDRYERLCQFLESKTYSTPPFDLNHSEGEQLVFKAIEKNNILVVKQLVELGYNLDKIYEQELTAVEYAKEQGRSQWFVRYLESCISKSE